MSLYFPTDADRQAAAAEAGRLLGSRGGSKGGKIRAQNLSAARRFEIASNAAKARWKKCRERQLGYGGIEP